MKFKRALFNIVVYALLAFTIVSAAYVSLPDEIKAQIPQVNDWIAGISGLITLLLGSGGLAVQTWLSKAKNDADTKYNLLGEKYLLLTQKYDELYSRVDGLDKTQIKTNNLVSRSNELLEADLSAKLNNDLLDQRAREIIEGVLDKNEQKGQTDL